MAELLTFRLVRDDPSQSWGFRLHGGKDFGTPLLIQKVNVGGLAERAGLRVGDAIVRVNDDPVIEQRHKDVQDAIIRAGNAFDVTVQRGGLETWRPLISPVGSVSSPNPYESTSPVPGFNTSSKPFSPQPNRSCLSHEGGENGAIKAIVNKQFNTPVGIYSDESIAETLSAQAEVLAGGVLGVNFTKNEKNYNPEGSKVFEMLRESENEPKLPETGMHPSSMNTGSHHVTAPRPSRSPALNPGKNVCADCERPIVGVFVRIKGNNLHVECFKCATCGNSLKNIGYYSINERLYCDIHAKLVARQNPPTPNPEQSALPPPTFSQPYILDSTPWKRLPSPCPFNPSPIAASFNRFATSQSPYLMTKQGDIMGTTDTNTGHTTSTTTSSNIHSSKTVVKLMEERERTHQICKTSEVTTAATFPVQRLPFLRPRGYDDKPKVTHRTEKKNETTKTAVTGTERVVPITIAFEQQLITDTAEKNSSTFTSAHNEHSVSLTTTPVPSVETEIFNQPECNSACSGEIARIMSECGGCESSDDFDIEEDSHRKGDRKRKEATKKAQFVAIGMPHSVRSLSPCEPIMSPNQVVVFPPELPPYLGTRSSHSPHSPMIPSPLSIDSQKCRNKMCNKSWADSDNKFDKKDVIIKNVTSIGTKNNNCNNKDISNLPINRDTQQMDSHCPKGHPLVDDSFSKAEPAETPFKGGPFASALTIAPQRPFTPLQSVSATIFSEDTHLPEQSECYKPEDNNVFDSSDKTTCPQMPSRPCMAEALTFTENAIKDNSVTTTSNENTPPSLPSLNDDPSAILRQASTVTEKSSEKKVDEGHLSRASLRQELEKKMEEKQAVWRAERRCHNSENAPPSRSSSRQNTPANFEATVSTCNKVFGNTNTITRHASSSTSLHTKCLISRSPSPLPSRATPFSPISCSTLHEEAQTSTVVVTSVCKVTRTPSPRPLSVTSIQQCEWEKHQQQENQMEVQSQRSQMQSYQQSQSQTSSMVKEQLCKGVDANCSSSNNNTTSRKVAASLLSRRLASSLSHSNTPDASIMSSTCTQPSITSSNNNNIGSSGLDLGSCGRGAAAVGATVSTSSAGLSVPRRGKGVWNPQIVTPGARIPLCALCNSQIRGPFVTALGKIWCPEHFICVNDKCNRSLLEIGFVEEPSGLYCENCFEQYLAPTCGKCSSKIKTDCLNAIGKHFHPSCFTCAYCGKQFVNNPFFLEDGLPYCENDWNELFTTKCIACGFPIEAGDRWVEALNNNYHSPCFNCTICKTNLEGHSFYAKGGRPYCKMHSR